MKKVKYILILTLFFFISIVNVSASSFQPRASLYDSYDGTGKVYIGLWYEGPALNEITNTFKYDATLFNVENVTSDDFEVDTSIEEREGKYKIVTITAKADSDYENAYYAVVELGLKRSFRIGDTSFITLTNYYAGTSEGLKYKNEGLVLTINYHSLNDIYLIAEEKTSWTDFEMWINDRLYMFLFCVVIIIGLIILFLITPHNFIATNRRRRVKGKIKGNKFNENISAFKLDPDEIATIGEKPKEEPKNKLELGNYNPLAENKSKPKQHLSKERDFKAANKDIFNNSKKN